MTVDGSVEGGLDEPTELEPEQGSLQLASDDDQHTRADWEKAAAAVLRKARRMKDDDPDDLVWQRLTTTTLDDIEVAPVGSPELLEELRTGGRPTRSGEWDIRAHLGGADAKALNEAALVDLDGGVTSLWLEVDPDTDLATVLDGVLLDLAPVVLDAPADRPDAQASRGPRLPGGAGRHDARRRHQPRRPRRQRGRGRLARPRRRRARGRRRRHDGPRPRRVGRPGARLVDGHGRGLPAGADGRGLLGRRGRRADGVPLRRHRRAVPDDGQAAGRAPAVAPGARAQRGRRATTSSASTW